MSFLPIRLLYLIVGDFPGSAARTSRVRMDLEKRREDRNGSLLEIPQIRHQLIPLHNLSLQLSLELSRNE